MRALIVGQALGEKGGAPWSVDGPSLRRLCKWFNVKDGAELNSKFTCMNVARYAGNGIKGDKYVRDVMLEGQVLVAIDRHDIVFMVGRLAQRILYYPTNVRGQVLWNRGKYVGLPHPSGLNIQLNSVSDDRIKEYIASCLVWLNT